MLWFTGRMTRTLNLDEEFVALLQTLVEVGALLGADLVHDLFYLQEGSLKNWQKLCSPNLLHKISES